MTTPRFCCHSLPTAAEYHSVAAGGIEAVGIAAVRRQGQLKYAS
jgi:hypothetical protein